MLIEITLILLAIMILLVIKKNQKKELLSKEETFSAIVINKDIESRMLKLHYFCAFKINNKKTTIFEITENLYYKIEIGDTGSITYKYNEFIKFVKDEKKEHWLEQRSFFH